MAFDGAYKPRRLTGAEQAAEREQAVKKKARLIRRVRNESDANSKPSKRYTLSAVAGIAYRDFTLGKSASTKSRVALDAAVYAARRDQPRTPTRLDAVPKLADLCLAILADSYGQPGILDALDPVHHRSHIPEILDRIEEAASSRTDEDERASGAAFPFQVWLDVASRTGGDLPTRRKTYRGLVMSDTAELDVLKELNLEAEHRHLAGNTDPSPAFPGTPAHFLAYLDLSSLPTFTDNDIYRLRDPLSHFLAVLRLEGTGVTDAGLEWIARAAKDRPQYQRLEVLGLRGLKNVTEAGVVPLARLTSLRLLDVRGTGCTAAVRTNLNKRLISEQDPASPSPVTYFRAPRKTRKDLETHAEKEATLSMQLELELFDATNFSPAHTIALLHYLGSLGSPPALPASTLRDHKPLGVHLTSLSRAPAPFQNRASVEDRSTLPAEELYQAHLAARSSQVHATHHAAYGGLTSTVAISREAVEESGRKEPSERGAAFRVRDDAVMGGGGGWVPPPQKTEGRRARPSGGSGRNLSAQEREPYSDEETEALSEAAYVEAESAALAERAREDETTSLFYRRGRAADAAPEPRGPRRFGIPLKEEGRLLRLMPYVPPWEGARRAAVSGAEGPAPWPDTQSLVEEMQRRREGGAKRSGGGELAAPTLVKKRRRETGDLPQPQRQQQQQQQGSSPRTAQPGSDDRLPGWNPFGPASNDLFGSAPTVSSRAKAAPQTGLRRTGASSKPLFTPRHEPKNIFKPGQTLLKRSSLAAFRR